MHISLKMSHCIVLSVPRKQAPLSKPNRRTSPNLQDGFTCFPTTYHNRPRFNARCTLSQQSTKYTIASYISHLFTTKTNPTPKKIYNIYTNNADILPIESKARTFFKKSKITFTLQSNSNTGHWSLARSQRCRNLCPAHKISCSVGCIREYQPFSSI